MSGSNPVRSLGTRLRLRLASRSGTGLIAISIWQFANYAIPLLTFPYLARVLGVEDHFPAARHDEDRRQGFSPIAQRNAAHNETLAVLDFLPAWRRPIFLAWAFTMGTRANPGLLNALRLLCRWQTDTGQGLRATLSGRLAGIRTYLRGAQS